jgi:hypothetical protein
MKNELTYDISDVQHLREKFTSQDDDSEKSEQPSS